jgi:hypothetical protein
MLELAQSIVVQRFTAIAWLIVSHTSVTLAQAMLNHARTYPILRFCCVEGAWQQLEVFESE